MRSPCQWLPPAYRNVSCRLYEAHLHWPCPILAPAWSDPPSKYVDVETKVLLSSFLLTPSQPQGWDFLGGPMVKTSPSRSWDGGSIPGQGAEIPTCLLAKKPKQKIEAIL